METNKKENDKKRCCRYCSHFNYWDGDWCCTSHLRIISGIENNQTLDIENCERDRSDCSEWEDDDDDSTPQRKKFREEEYEFFKNGGVI